MIHKKVRALNAIKKMQDAMNELYELDCEVQSESSNEVYDIWNDMISQKYPFIHSIEDTIKEVEVWWEDIRASQFQIEVHVCEKHDRFVYIKRNQKNEVVELNYMQGCSDIEQDLFRRDYMKFDCKLLEFYNTCIQYKVYADEKDELERINNILWLYAPMEEVF